MQHLAVNKSSINLRLLLLCCCVADFSGYPIDLIVDELEALACIC